MSGLSLLTGAVFGGIGIYQHSADAKQKKIDEIKKYSDAACDAYEELDVDQKFVKVYNAAGRENSMRLEDKEERKKASTDKEKQQARILRYYRTALMIACEMNGGKIGDNTVDEILYDPEHSEADINQLENQEAREALLRASNVYLKSFPRLERLERLKAQQNDQKAQQKRIQDEQKRREHKDEL